MSRLFIFGIGGSGSRVIRALDMLLACGVPQFRGGDQIFPIMIDYDVNNGDTKRTFKFVETYHNIHKCAYPNALNADVVTDGLFFHTPMMEMKDLGGVMTSKFTMQFRNSPNEKKFSDVIGYDQLRDEKSITQDLLKTLYDVSTEADTELNIDMTVGFKGNPNIGSVVFANLKDSDEFNDFANAYRVEANDKVILIGSLFGGTGSSGIPEIVKGIREREGLGETVKLGVIMLMPYFGFETEKEKCSSVRSTLFNSKTRASLAFYESSGMNNKINSIYYIGDKVRTTVPYSMGGETQTNNSHIVDLIAAISILHFVENVTDTRGNKYKYRMHDTAPSSKPGFTLANFYKSEVRRIIKPLLTMAFAIKFFQDEILKSSEVVTKRAYYKGFNLSKYIHEGRITMPRAITSNNDNEIDSANLHATLYYFQMFCEQFKEWTKELADIGNHSLVMFDFNRTIASIVQDCKLSEEQKGWTGGISEKEIVEPLNFSEEFQRYYHKNYENAHPAGLPLRFEKKTAGFAFLDCLKNGVDAVLSKPQVKRILNLD